MSVNKSLDKKILKMLLCCLLDVRATRYWARSLWQEGYYFYRPQDHYSLVDKIGLSRSSSLDALVNNRLEWLCLQKSPDLSLLLEKAQLLAWKTLQTLERPTAELNSSSDFFQDDHLFEKGLQELVEALVKLQKMLKNWKHRLFSRALKKQIDFLTRAIRLEMKEISLPQHKVESGMALIEKASNELEQAAVFLEKGDLEACYHSVKQALCFRPYSLNYQSLDFFIFLLIRFKRAIEKLEKVSRFQKPVYRLYLLQRADKALKRSCHLLRFFNAESQLPLVLQERLSFQVQENWQLMIKQLDEESLRYNQTQADYWLIWAHACVYRLGLGYSGVLQVFTNVEGALKWALEDTLAQNAHLRLVISILALIHESLLKPQLCAESIDLVRIQLEFIKKISPALGESINRSIQDLNLLYIRAEPYDSKPVFQASGRLLSISWQAQNPETVVVCLQCLEDLYDIWSGSSV